jgi:hypothetical protein
VDMAGRTTACWAETVHNGHAATPFRRRGGSSYSGHPATRERQGQTVRGSWSLLPSCSVRFAATPRHHLTKGRSRLTSG